MAALGLPPSSTHVRTYGRVIEELEDSPQPSAEEAVNLARMSVGGESCTRSVRPSEGS